MNKKQKVILLVVTFVVVAMFLYPPIESYKDGKSMGYHLITTAMYHGENAVDVPLIFAQWMGVLIVGAIAYFMAKDKKD